MVRRQEFLLRGDVGTDIKRRKPCPFCPEDIADPVISHHDGAPLIDAAL